MNSSGVTLVDYGLGNLRAFQNIFTKLNIKVQTATVPSQILEASKLILPGVGSFDWAMDKLNASGLRPSLEEVVLQKKTPVLGICVGMQMMAESSAEGRMRGLGWIEGKVQKLNGKSLENKRAFGQENHPAEVLILPHMGWNDVHVVGESPLLHLVDKPKFYFLHSYYFLPSESSRTLGITEYGKSFCSAVGKNNIYGVQFHPEKSHHWGIQLLKNFYEKC